VRSGQYEDTCTPSMRLLLEEKRGKPKSEIETKSDSPPPLGAGEQRSKE
jgi:nitrogen fixation-related uncharacterized protein